MIQRILSLLILGLFSLSLVAQSEDESSGMSQSRESAAVDATAAQWSFQFAFQGFNKYKDDIMDNGVQRPPGNKNFFQFRLVAPIPKTEKFPIMLLPRLTLRYQQNAADRWGLGGSDLFVLGILKDWGTGRSGIGPQINFPAQKVNNPKEPGDTFGSTEWGFGLAGAVTQRALNDRLFVGILLQQVWLKGNAAPIGINPILVYQLGKGWYVGNGDFVIQYNWQNGGWFVPFGARLGKAFINPKSTWNVYLEYQTPLAYKKWIGDVPSNFIRVNVQFQIPVG